MRKVIGIGETILDIIFSVTSNHLSPFAVLYSMESFIELHGKTLVRFISETGNELA